MINWAVFSPHPPLLIPEVGGDMLKRVQLTKDSLQNVFSEVDPVKTVIVITPHGFAARNSLTVIDDDSLSGQLSNFGGNAPELDLEVDRTVVEQTVQAAQTSGIAVNTISSDHLNRGEELLDHGAYVPLYYALQTLSYKPRVVVINPGLLSVDKLWDLGEKLAENWQALQQEPQQLGVIISGDLSHGLSYTAPAGYHPEAHKFDEKIQSLLQEQDLSGLLELPADLLKNAAECGYRPLVLGSSIIGGKMAHHSKVLSYEAPFGVGYLVARLM